MQLTLPYRALKRLSLCLAASLVLSVLPSFAADKPQYMPAIAPKSDTPNEETMPPKAPDRALSHEDVSTAARDRTKPLLKQALERHQSGDEAGAERLFQQVLSIDPGNPDASFNLGVMAEDRHDWQSALNYFNTAAKANPNDSDIRDAIASVKEQLRNSNGGDQNTQNSAQKQRLNQLGRSAAAAYKAGRYDEAIADLESISRLQPNDADTQFALGQAFRGKGDLVTARQYLSRAVALDPNNQLYRTALQQADADSQNPQTAGNPQQAPDYAQPYHPRRQDSGWQEEDPSAKQPPQDSGLQAYTSQGENQLQGQLSQNGRMGGFGLGSGMGTLGAMGAGAGTGLGVGALFGLLRGGLFGSSQYGYSTPYGYSPYGYSPYGYGTVSPYSSPFYNHNYGYSYRMGRRHW